MKTRWLLFSVLVLCLVTAAAFAADIPASVPIVPGVPAQADIPTGGTYAYFSFVPETSGTYIFSSSAETDTYGYAYDADMLQLASDDDSGENNNFSLSCVLTAGETYYFAARFYSSDNVGSFPVTLEAYHGLTRVSPVEYAPAVKPGESVTLAVEAAVTDGGVYYAWALSSAGDPVPGADGSSYTTPPITQSSFFFCTVSDDYGHSRQVQFVPWIDNGLQAQVVGEPHRTVTPGAVSQLEVSASCTEGDLTYTWSVGTYDTYGFLYDVKTVQDATGPSLTTAALEHRCAYTCQISDKYGNTLQKTFTFDIDNQLSAAAAGDTDLHVAPGATPTLTVEASCNAGTLEYMWYETVYDGPRASTETIIDDAHDPSFTPPPVTQRRDYRCIVNDSYGNSRDVSFSLQIDNQFSAEAVGDTDLTVAPESPLQLAVSATCLQGPLTYVWYQSSYDPAGDRWTAETQVDGASSASWDIASVSTAMAVYCYVSDPYGNMQTVGFSIGIDNAFSASALGSTRFSVPLGGTSELSVNASCATGPLSYRWTRSYRSSEGYWREERIDSAMTGTLQVGPLEQAEYYECQVSDAYGNHEEIYFDIGIDNGLVLEAATQREILVPPGETAELRVTASCESGSIQLQWSRTIRDSDGISSVIRIDGANADTLVTDPVSESMEYSCTALDQYGNSTDVWFTVGIENHLTIKPLGPQDITVRPGESLELAAEVSCDSGDLSISWEEQIQTPDGSSDWRTMDGATSSSLTIPSVTHAAQYIITATDDFGSRVDCWFNVGIKNNLTVRADGPSRLTAGAGDTVTLHALGSCSEGTLSYFWYRIVRGTDYYDEYPVADGSDTYTTEPIEAYQEYRCSVVDIYGNSQSARFYISVSNHLTVTLLSEPEVYIEPGASATFALSADCDQGEIEYQWRRRTYNPDGSWQTSDLPGGTASSYTTGPLTETAYYECVVSDDYEAPRTYTFTAHIDNGLKAVWNEYTEVSSGEPVTFEVEAICNQGELNYAWKRHSTLIPSATGPVYTIDQLTSDERLTCIVTDMFGNRQECFFSASVNSVWIRDMSATVNGQSARWQDDRIVAAEGSTVAITADAVGSQGPLYYAWYIDGEPFDCTESTLTLTDVTQNANIVCQVTDNGNGEALWECGLMMDSGLTVTPSGETIRTVAPGDQITLAVSASVRKGSLSYEWIYGGEILDEAGDSLTFVPDRSTSCICRVCDDYECVQEVEFILLVGSPRVLVPGESAAVSLTGDEKQQFFFTPQESGLYILTSAGGSDPVAVLYNDEGSEVARNDDYNGELNFRLEAYLTAGEQYRYSLHSYSDTDSFTVRFVREASYEIPSGTYVLLPGQTAVWPYEQAVLTSGDPSVISISGTTLTALKAGSVRVTARYDTWETTVNFMVRTGSVLRMPSALTSIEASAFAGDRAVRFVSLASGTRSVGMYAFSQSSLEQITVPSPETTLALSSFYGLTTTILCPSGSAAHHMAESRGLPFLFIP